MSFYSDKVRKYWFPFIILMIVVLAAGWILAGVIYPNNVQGGDQQLPTSAPPTATHTATSTQTSTPTLVLTSTATRDAASATPTTNCTYTDYYWKTHPDQWLIENILLGNLSYTREEAIEIMTLKDPTPTEQLMGQFFAALLNTLKGADSSEIDPVMIKARDWLILRPHGIDLSPADILEIETYTQQLEAFNTGQVGPGQCSDEPWTPTPEATDTPTPTATYTPGPDQPFFTATATQGSGGGRPRPTNTQGPPPATNPPATTKPPATPTTKPPPTPVVPPTPAPTRPPPTEAPPPPSP